MIVAICSHCGKEFQTYPSVVRSGRRYCSRACSRIAFRRFSGPNSWHWKGGRLIRSCDYCGRAYSCSCSRGAKRQSRFCSPDCYFSYRVGDVCPTWKGGISKRPDYAVIVAQRRRARVANAIGNGVTEREWREILARFGDRCAWCRRSENLIVKLSMDHVVPLARGGAHRADNIQPLCIECNSKKGTRMIYFEPDGSAFEVTDMRVFLQAVLDGLVPLEAVQIAG